MASGIKGTKKFGEIFLGCKVQVWSSNQQRYLEGVVDSYDHKEKMNLVVYTNGDRQMLNLGPPTGNHQDRMKIFIERQAVRKFHDQGWLGCKRKNSAHSPCARLTKYDVAYHQTQVSKKLKVESFDPVTPGRTSSTKINCSMVKEGKEQKPKITISPITTDPKILVSQDSKEMVDVNGFKVKVTVAPILEAIFAKYGNIAANSLFKSKPVTSSLLEVVCDIVQRLQNYFVDDILLDLKAIGNEVSDVEAARIEVSWLRKHLEKFHEVSAFHNKNLLLKKSKVNVDLLVETANEKLRQRRGELVLAQERVKEAETCMTAMNLEAANEKLRQRHAELVLAQERVKEAEKWAALNIVSRKIDEDINISQNEEYFWRRRLGGLLEGAKAFSMQY